MTDYNAAAWARDPSFPRVLREGVGYGAALGFIVGSATWIFQGNPYGLFLGLAFGSAYGLVFATGGWMFGWLAFRLNLSKRKGNALAVGVFVTALVGMLVVWALGGTLDPVLIIAPSFIAVLVATARGRAYDHKDTDERRQPGSEGRQFG